MTFQIIPIERKQPIQISIFKKLAVCFVAFLVVLSSHNELMLQFSEVRGTLRI
jgi:hypothetical protein